MLTNNCISTSSAKRRERAKNELDTKPRPAPNPGSQVKAQLSSTNIYYATTACEGPTWTAAPIGDDVSHTQNKTAALQSQYHLDFFWSLPFLFQRPIILINEEVQV